MSKCTICKERAREWTWQPFGPDTSHLSFTTPGSHYRGFPALAVCEYCKRLIEMGGKGSIIFRYKYHLYRVTDAGVEPYHKEGERITDVP
jgi:hypothetical protein